MPFELTQEVVDAFMKPMEQGDWAPFEAAIDPNVKWWISSDLPRRADKCAGTYTYKEWMDEVRAPMLRRFTGKHTMEILSSHVNPKTLTAYVESKGYVQQKCGRPYDNCYCWIFKFSPETGKVVEMREYMDSELVAEVFRLNKDE
ncbi:hypothetical protein JCM6882_009241 [Rhodosporidiobolus microsporus]